MNIIKRHKKNNFLVLDKTALNDPSLSWQAKGLHAYLMGLPIEWEVNVRDLTNRSTNGKDSTSAVINELIKAGYVKRERITEKGKFAGYDYSVFETPQTANPITVKPNTEKPNTGFPITVKPITENPQQISIEVASIEVESIDLISSSSSSSREIFQNFEEEKQPPKTNTDEVPQKAFAAVALEKANVSDFEKFAIERNPELAGVNIDYQYYFDSAKSKSNAKTAEKLYASALGFIRTDSSGTGIRIKQSININNQNRNNEKSNNQKSASAFNPKKVNSDTRVKSARQIAEEEAFRADKQAREAAAATQQQQASE